MLASRTPTIRMIRPSSREKFAIIAKRIRELESNGFTVLYEELPEDSNQNITSSTLKNRAEELRWALKEDKSDIILCARGGYGASDLLELIFSQNADYTKEKLLVGFSDISALHSAIYTILGRKSLHAPMPATTLWGTESMDDIQSLYNILKSPKPNGQVRIHAAHNAHRDHYTGTLFGGCFSVLTNMIGTPFFPKSLAGFILFFEDINESPGRLLRSLNQWRYSGAFDQVQALVLGQFIDCNHENTDWGRRVAVEFSKRLDIPVFESFDFGHCSPNFPLMIGAQAKISHDTLNWF